MPQFQHEFFNPREVIVMPPGSNKHLNDNSTPRAERLGEIARSGAPMPPKKRLWSDEDLQEVIKVCQYVSNNLPDEAFGLHGVPGLRIFPEPDCLAIGVDDWSVGSYSVIRGGVTGVVEVRTLSDRGLEADGFVAFHRVSDAVKSIFF